MSGSRMPMPKSTMLGTVSASVYSSILLFAPVTSDSFALSNALLRPASVPSHDAVMTARMAGLSSSQCVDHLAASLCSASSKVVWTPVTTDQMHHLSSPANSDPLLPASVIAFGRDASCLRLMIMMFISSVELLAMRAARLVAASFGYDSTASLARSGPTAAANAASIAKSFILHTAETTAMASIGTATAKPRPLAAADTDSGARGIWARSRSALRSL